MPNLKPSKRAILSEQVYQHSNSLNTTGLRRRVVTSSHIRSSQTGLRILKVYI